MQVIDYGVLKYVVPPCEDARHRTCGNHATAKAETDDGLRGMIIASVMRCL